MSLNESSRSVASSLGETEGRTVSARLGEGVSRLSCGAISREPAMDLVHCAMIAGAVSFATEVVPRRKLVVVGGLAGAVLWWAGGSKR